MTTSPHPRAGQRRLNRVLLLGIGLVVTLEVAYLGVANLWFPDLLAKLAKAQGYELRMDRAVSLFPGRLEFARLELSADRGKLRSAVLEGGEARVRLLDLLQQELHVTRADIRDLRIEFGSSSAEGLRAEHVDGPPLARQRAALSLAAAPARPAVLSVDHLRAANAAFQWNDFRVEGELKVELRGLRVARGSTGVKRVDLALEGADLVKGAETLISEVHGTAGYRQQPPHLFVHTVAVAELLPERGDVETLGPGVTATLRLVPAAWELTTQVPEVSLSFPRGAAVSVRGLDARLSPIGTHERAHLRTRPATLEVTLGETRLEARARLALDFAAESAIDSGSPVETRGGSLELDDLRVERFGSTASGMRATLAVERGRLSRAGSELAGALRGSGPDFAGALGLLAGPRRQVALTDVLGTHPFTIDGQFRRDEHDARLDDIHIESAGLDGRGAARFGAGGARGSLLLRHGGLSLGVNVTSQEVSTVFGAGNRWLKQRLRALEP